jgi:uncharacterized protein
LNLYLDTSALVKLYWWEADASVVRTAVRRAEQLATARVAWSEVLATIARKRREGVPARTCTRVSASFRSDWQDLTIVAQSDPVDALVETLHRRHALRGFDALHLAAALHWQALLGNPIAFACADERLRDAAQDEGLTLVPA